MNQSHKKATLFQRNNNRSRHRPSFLRNIQIQSAEQQIIQEDEENIKITDVQRMTTTNNLSPLMNEGRHKHFMYSSLQIEK